MRKGQKHSEESLAKMRGRPSSQKGTKFSEETKEKMRRNRKGKGLGNIPWMKGKTHSAETRKKLSIAGKGRPSWNKGLKGYKAGPQHYAWIGDDVKYGGLHDWVRRTLGQPDTCEQCGKSGLSGHQIHWANLSQEYKREVTDWVRLCAKCHTDFDSLFRRSRKGN